tara:strand:+ start:1783 stop:3234 length:1452 start_codon:yes stop_codon:yes gene_type:complete
MLFNSIDFAIYLPLVFILYWFVTNKNLKLQNTLLLFASYFFYGWWDWRFLSLIIFSSVVDYLVGLGIGKSAEKNKRLILLWISITVNLGFLGFFKYYNFFLDNFVEAFSLLGHSIDPQGLNIILPVGISFYTFQTLSYSIDVYKNKLEPTKNLVAFFAYVSFFPQLVAGPIERATNLLPQFFQKRTFDYNLAADGMRQILWGLFKKIVIADNCAIIVNDIFANSADYSGSTLLVGGILFAFQIYGDFSGYSDIAIGTSRLFGFNLMQNFAFPYFSRDIAEFWRRWHISLSTWFRDYLYIPLGGSRGGTSMKIRNTFAIFIVSGFWHGANWTFIIWGALNALYFLPLLLTKSNRRNMEVVARGKYFPTISEMINISSTFMLTVIAWIFFRAENITHAINYISELFSESLFSIPDFNKVDESYQLIALIGILIVVEWLGRSSKHGLERIACRISKSGRWCLYIILILIIGIFKPIEDVPFIYFQF